MRMLSVISSLVALVLGVASGMVQAQPAPLPVPVPFASPLDPGVALPVPAVVIPAQPVLGEADCELDALVFDPGLSPDERAALAKQARVAAEYARSVNLFRLEEYAKCSRTIALLRMEAPRHGQSELLSAQVSLVLGNYRMAVDSLRRALEVLPQEAWGEIPSHYAEYYQDGRDYSDQISALQRYARRYADKVEGPLLLAYHYAYLGYPRDAAINLELARRLAPDDRLVELLSQQIAPLEDPALAAPPAMRRPAPPPVEPVEWEF